MPDLRETVERLDKLHKEATPGPIATDRTEHTYSRCVFGERGEGVREWVAHYMSQPDAEFTAAIFNAWPQLSAALQARQDEPAPPEILASKLIDAWVADKGRQISWRRAIEIAAIVTKQPQAEVDRLLALGADDDGRCEMCGQPLPAPPEKPE